MRIFIFIIFQLLLIGEVRSEDSIPRPRLFGINTELSIGNNFYRSGQWIYSPQFKGSCQAGIEFDINTDYFRKRTKAISWILNYQYRYAYEKYNFNTFYDYSGQINFTHTYFVHKLIPSFALKLRFNASKFKYEFSVGEISYNSLYLKRKIGVSNNGVEYFNEKNHSSSPAFEILKSSVWNFIPWYLLSSETFIIEGNVAPLASNKIRFGLSVILNDFVGVHGYGANYTNYIPSIPQYVESIRFSKNCFLIKIQYSLR